MITLSSVNKNIVLFLYTDFSIASNGLFRLSTGEREIIIPILISHNTTTTYIGRTINFKIKRTKNIIKVEKIVHLKGVFA